MYGNCKSIRILRLNNCNKLTSKGIQAALDNLPQLRELDHEFLFEFLATIAQTAISQKLILPQYSLTKLNISRRSTINTVYKSGSLRQSLLLCPNVTQFQLFMTEGTVFNDNELLNLLLLKKIYHIDIRNYAADQIGGVPLDVVRTLLKKFGSHLKTLMLHGFCSIDLAAIIQFCPNLESLHLNECRMNKRYQSKEAQMEWPILRNLQKLYICDFRYSLRHPGISGFTSEDLLALLSSPLLSCIDITYCSVLTDKVLQRAAHLHSFRNLEYLTLDDSNAVSKKAIDNIFLQDFNPLKKIFLSETINGGIITRKDYIDWNENAIWIKKNWQFKFMLKRSYYDDNGTRIHLGEHKDIGGPWWYEHSDLIELLVYHRFCLNGRLLYDFSGLLGPPVRDRALI